jgi:hypothetical protein
MVFVYSYYKNLFGQLISQGLITTISLGQKLLKQRIRFMSVASVYNLEKQNIKKYNTCYSHLSNLILNMTEEQQSLLLEQAHQVINEDKKSTLLNFIQDRNWILISGFILGCFFTSLLFTIFAIN